MESRKQADPIIVAHLFPDMLEELLALLSSLSAEEWTRPTACAGWSVKDVAAHLLGDEIGNLSRKRDGYTSASPSLEGWADLVAWINASNSRWVEATRGISPRLLCDLLALAGTQVSAYFGSLDPYAIGGPVSWAGPDPAPVWLDVAREYTERWLHQQHIRDAVGKPGLTQARFLAPVLDTFARALPHTYRNVGAADGTLVALTIPGRPGGRWLLLREKGTWNLYRQVDREPHAEVTVDADTAWRLFTRGMARDQAQAVVTFEGDRSLGLPVLDMVSIIA